MATLPLPIVPRTVPLSPCAPAPRGNRPSWLRVRFPQGPNYTELRTLMREQNLHTICEEAMCPNIGECWENRTATFLILGEICTRNCGFCSVTTGRPTGLDLDEPRRLAEAVERIGLRHIVITSVTRDDLPDFGATQFARTITETRARIPSCRLEVLIPDFQGDRAALQIVLAAGPDVLNHNIETVPRLYRAARPGGRYTRALDVLRTSRELAPDIPTKSGLMVGLGEEWDEVVQTLQDLRDAGVKIVTIGQYLRPSLANLPMERYYTPSEFAELKRIGLEMGFGHVESGPLVRSSYHAHEQTQAFEASR